MAYIEISNLNYSYPLEKEYSLKDINLSIAKGSILLVTGKSGSGKSTLARALVGTVPQFYGGTIGGEIKIDGTFIQKISHKERAEKITMVFQDPEKQLMMNKVHREVAFGLENTGTDEKTIKRRVYEALQFSGILHLAERDILSLSGGEKQKVAVASALAYMPQCIVFDEPTSQMDPSSAEEILNLVKKINEELGITIIVIEQRVNRWFDAADSIAVMEKGKLNLFRNKCDFYSGCSDSESMFLPDYLKFFKSAGFSSMPVNFKNARTEISKSSLKFSESKEVPDKKISEPILDIKKLSCSYDSKIAVKDLNLTVNRGDFLSIMGPNGAGKSTILKAVMGLIKYDGSIKSHGREIKSMQIRDIAKSIGYISQNPNDYLSKDSVYDEVKFTMDNYGIYDENTINEVLKELDIFDIKEKNPRDLSGGQRQRVAIASILVLKPDIILLDEPTRGIESELKIKLGQILKKLNMQGTTIILITHDVDFAALFCRRFVLLFNGSIAADGTKKEVLSGGIFYTTSINKLLKEKSSNIFTLEEALRTCVL